MGEGKGRRSYDEPTRNYYDLHADERSTIYASAPSPHVRMVSRFFEKGARVLDVGCGSGRDLRAFLDEGYDAYGIEPSDGMRRKAAELYNLDEARLKAGSLPLRPGEGGDAWLEPEFFDFVLASAVLQHIEEKDLFETFFSLDRVLKNDGLVLLSVPASYPGVNAGTKRDPTERIFLLRPPEQYAFFLSRLGFDLLHREDAADGLGRPGIVWTTLLFRKRNKPAARPLRQIESILREDAKTTTYKFALLRTLAELAVTRPNIVKWCGSGTVRVPIDPVVDKWIEYYWPLIREGNIPQGHKSEGKSDIAFRGELEKLVALFPAASGGLKSFVQTTRSEGLRGTVKEQTEKVRLAVAGAIMKGPVRYSGSEKTEGKLFKPAGKGFTMPAELWAELSILGRWIEDAVVLRWAEFTADLRDTKADIAAVAGLLLESAESRRDVGEAQKIYKERITRTSLCCVWSGKQLAEDRLAVDHAIPFALWRNNDLWNLLPTDQSVNGRKRDKLPTQRLIDSAKNRITECWEMLYEGSGSRFLKETREFLGRRTLKDFSIPLREELFSAFRESVESTAVQRGTPRWNG